jgi:hypothetical protein
MSSWDKKSADFNIAQDDRTPVSPFDENELDRVIQAQQRLARHEIELRQIIRYCNSEMDIVRRKLCKDLQILEMLKEEIDKAGTGPLREDLEQDFHDGMLYNDLIDCRIYGICCDINETKRESGRHAG